MSDRSTINIEVFALFLLCLGIAIMIAIPLKVWEDGELAKVKITNTPFECNPYYGGHDRVCEGTLFINATGNYCDNILICANGVKQ
jgi:hypothetical protein